MRKSREITAWCVLAAGVFVGAWLWRGGRTTFADFTPSTQPARSTLRVAGGSPEAVGRYLVRVGGCNDCHTPGFMMIGEDVPESQWLTGVPVGWQGPWGTTYSSNLRKFVKDLNKDQWIEIIRARKARPPMPWSALHAMSDDDLGAVFAYIKSLGQGGQDTPTFVPPGQEPKTPYLVMIPKLPKGMEMPSTQPVK
jgi:mono/diheme cytochrome c family protein